MRKMKFFGLLLSFFLLIGTGIGLSAAFGNISVKLTYNVNNVNDEQANISQAHGGPLTHIAPETYDDSGAFNYWLVNGIFRDDLDRNLSIVTRSTLELVAVYGHKDKPTVTFIDSNGKYIKHLFVESGTKVPTLDIPEAPGKPQSTFARWEEFRSSAVISDPITSNTVFIATYIEDDVTAELVVDGETTVHPINSVVTLTLGEGFTHFEDGNGNVLSYADTFSFSMLVANREVVRKTGGEKAPVVNMIAETGLREGHTSYIGQFYSNGPEVIEYGFIISRSKDVLTIDSPGATVIPSNVYNPQTNEFLRSFPEDSYNSIRAYAIFAGGIVEYSDYMYGGYEILEQVVYETGFETANPKTSYALGEMEDGLTTWILSEALRGDLGDDKKLGTWAIRGRSEGYAKINQDYSNLSKIEFMYAHYGSLNSGVLSLEVSPDSGTTWINVWTMPSGKQSTLSPVTVNIDYDNTEGIALGDNLKVRWVFLGQEIGNNSRMNIDEIKLHSFTTVAQHEIVLDGSAPIFVNDGDLISDIPTKTGYTFEGWYEDADFNTKFAGEVKQSLTLYAKFSIKSVTLSFNVDGGTPVSSIIQNYGTGIITPEEPTKEGYTFNGWNPELPTIMPAENQEFTAKWMVNQYTITFNTNGGDTLDSLTQDFGSTLSLPVPVKEGYNFNGWYKDISLTEEFNETVMGSENIILYADWLEASSTSVVTFETNGGSLILPATVVNGEVVAQPEDPTKDGFTFRGWYSDIDFTSQYVFTTAVTTNITIYAKWENTIISFTERVIFGNNNSSASKVSKPNFVTLWNDRAPDDLDINEDDVVTILKVYTYATLSQNDNLNLKIGNSTANGTELTINFPNINIESITISASRYGTDTGVKLNVNGQSSSELTATVTDYVFNINGSQFDLVLTGKRAYIYSIQFTYTLINP